MSTELVESIRFRKHIAEEIRALLGRREMSRIELARRIERSHTYMWRRLNGETTFDVDDLRKIAAVLGVDVVDLLPKVDVTGGRQPTAQYLPGERVVARVGDDDRASRPSAIHRPAHRVGSKANAAIRPLTAVGR